MRKSVLFLTLVAMVAFASCGNKSKDDANGQNAECKEKEEFATKWAQFDSLAIEEQEALLAKRAECFAKFKAKCAEKQAEKKESCTNENKTDEQKTACQAKKQAMAELDNQWANFETMTIAEKKAFFDTFDQIKPKKGDCKEKKECNKEKEECNKAEKCCGEKDNKNCDNKDKKSCDKPCDKK